MPDRETISACLIVHDEEERLPAALASVDWCDELVVVDSGSRDGAREIARSGGATVVELAWLGFGAQRNVAIDRATSYWILEVDADERVGPPLRERLQAFLAGPPDAGLKIATLPLRHRFPGTSLGAAGDPSGALDWMHAARDAGADVALICDRDVRPEWWLQVQRMHRVDPVRVVRALDALEQVRPVEQLVSGPRWLSSLRRVVAEGRGGIVAPAPLHEDPAEVVRRPKEITR